MLGTKFYIGSKDASFFIPLELGIRDVKIKEYDISESYLSLGTGLGYHFNFSSNLGLDTSGFIDLTEEVTIGQIFTPLA